MFDEKRANDNREAINQIFNAGATTQPTNDGAKAEAKNANHSLGEQFINDPQFKSWYAGIKPSGVISDNIGVKSPVLTLESSVAVMVATVESSMQAESVTRPCESHSSGLLA